MSTLRGDMPLEWRASERSHCGIDKVSQSPQPSTLSSDAYVSSLRVSDALLWVGESHSGGGLSDQARSKPAANLRDDPTSRRLVSCGDVVLSESHAFRSDVPRATVTGRAILFPTIFHCSLGNPMSTSLSSKPCARRASIMVRSLSSSQWRIVPPEAPLGCGAVNTVGINAFRRTRCQYVERLFLPMSSSQL